MNDYDKAGRYLVKREPTGFFRWLLENPCVSFVAWVDARRVALPSQRDLTNDLVAVLSCDGVQEAVVLELEAEARADLLTRLLEYLGRIWAEPAGGDRIRVSCVSGVVLDLTGASRATRLRLRSAFVPGTSLEMSVLRRPMAAENAATLLADVAVGKASPWLLPWVPLMHGGGESTIIQKWLREAERQITDEQGRADLALIAQVFAGLAGCRPAWTGALRGWKMQTSPVFDEIRDEGRKEGRAEGRKEGRAEGRKEGRAEGMRETILRLGRQKYRRDPSKKQRLALEAITDPIQLDKIIARLLEVQSWTDLLNGH